MSDRLSTVGILPVYDRNRSLSSERARTNLQRSKRTSHHKTECEAWRGGGSARNQSNVPSKIRIDFRSLVALAESTVANRPTRSPNFSLALPSGFLTKNASVFTNLIPLGLIVALPDLSGQRLSQRSVYGRSLR